MVAMYTYIVDRTQIYLTAEESAALERASIETGKTQFAARPRGDRREVRLPSVAGGVHGRRSTQRLGAWKEEPGEDRSAYLKDLRRADLAKQRYLERLRRSEPTEDR